jgi:hypothetical protein
MRDIEFILLFFKLYDEFDILKVPGSNPTINKKFVLVLQLQIFERKHLNGKLMRAILRHKTHVHLNVAVVFNVY